jgi:hypothetical protein
MKKRLDRQQIRKACFVMDGFVETLERQIQISHPDCSET